MPRGTDTTARGMAGQALGQLVNKADLVGGKVPASQLPSYVDDVIEVANYESLPNPGESGKIYITTNDNKTYRWSGTQYAPVGGGETIIDVEELPQTGANIHCIYRLNASSGITYHIFKDGAWKELLTQHQALKTINGSVITGTGNVEIKTYQPFPNGQITGTLEQVVSAIMAFPTRAQGMAYLGGIAGSCTPFGYGNAECTVTFMTGSIALLTVSSSNIAPYFWQYNTAQNDYVWRAYEIQSNKVDNLSSASTNTQYPGAKCVYDALQGKQPTLSQDQLNAVNSGINSTKVATYDGYASQIAEKQPALNQDQLAATNSGINSTKVATYDGYSTTKQDICQVSNLTEPTTITMSSGVYYNLLYEGGNPFTTVITLQNPLGSTYAPEYKGIIYSTGATGETVTFTFETDLMIFTNDDTAIITANSLQCTGVKRYEFSIQNGIAYFVLLTNDN